LYNPRGSRSVRSARATPSDPEPAYTSREAAHLSGVPFFTIDYWGRTKFLVPSIAKGRGRGKGRQRMYSYGDVIRLRIARELRDQKVSLETLRAVVQKLAGFARELPKAHFVLVGREVELAASLSELTGILRRPDRCTFGVILDLRALLESVRTGARTLEAERAEEQET
jgi:DNA-binding transcriptional MerR regulator